MPNLKKKKGGGKIHFISRKNAKTQREKINQMIGYVFTMLRSGEIQAHGYKRMNKIFTDNNQCESLLIRMVRVLLILV
jgi:hypothetical protein